MAFAFEKVFESECFEGRFIKEGFFGGTLGCRFENEADWRIGHFQFLRGRFGSE